MKTAVMLGVLMVAASPLVLPGVDADGRTAIPPPPSVSAYDPSSDPFYRKPRINATWIMIWNGSTEKGWWKSEDYNGCTVEVDRKWQSINWNDQTHTRTYVEAIQAAGMDLILVDLTNGLRWEKQAKFIQQLCHDRGMKFAIAFNPQDGRDMESGCRRAWDTYAAPEAAHSDAYFHLDGKPLVVLYTWRTGYAASVAQVGAYRQRFTTTWASGEDSDRDKWGWQLDPLVGPVPSDHCMFITGSVKFNSPKTSEERWRKNLSWLDYGFLMAQKHHPRFLVVGSFDDVHERNAWMVVDTRAAKPGWQMRDITGAVNPTAYYQRVCDWVTKGKPTSIAGGLVKDGAYQIASSDHRLLGITDNRLVGSSATLIQQADEIGTYFWLYHLGNGEYRVIKLNAGFPLEADGTTVRTGWDSDRTAQRWMLKPLGDRFTFTNRASGLVLDHAQDQVVAQAADPNALSQRRTLIAIATLP